jgi:hypothetical protein
VNCSFENLRSYNDHAPCLDINTGRSSVNITDSSFRNCSSQTDFGCPGAVMYKVYSETNGDYKFAGNVFFDISSEEGAVQILGNFTSLVFENNSFINVDSVYEGGVFFFFFFYFIFMFILFILLK